jgi:protein-S-isoprenylcysteine O-methyltransferase Ste14
VMDRVFIVVEERMLDEKFGQAWLAYKGQTRRWV